MSILPGIRGRKNPKVKEGRTEAEVRRERGRVRERTRRKEGGRGSILCSWPSCRKLKEEKHGDGRRLSRESVEDGKKYDVEEY